MSGDPEQEYFADGITEDIITRLSAFRDLGVIARNSTMQYKGQNVDVRKIGEVLGATHVVEGSVRRSPEKIRVTAQLLAAEDGTHLWADAYDRDLSAADLFAIQDDITGKIAGAIGDNYGIIVRADIAESRREPPQNLSAYDCYLKIIAYYDQPTPTKHLHVRTCAEGAVEIEPNYALGWTVLAWMIMDEQRFGFNATEPDPMDRAYEAFQKALAIDAKSQIAHHGLAEWYFSAGNIDSFIAERDRAIALNPNNGNAAGALGSQSVLAGKYERGYALLRQAIALNPNYPTFYNFGLSAYHYNNRDYEQALETALQIDWHDFVLTLVFRAAAYGQLGRSDEAQGMIDKLLVLHPDFESSAEAILGFWNIPQSGIAHYAEGLAKSGLEIRIASEN